MAKKISIKTSSSGNINEFRIIGPGAAKTLYEYERLLKHLKSVLEKNPLPDEEPDTDVPDDGYVFIYEVDSDRKVQVNEKTKEKSVSLDYIFMDPIKKKWQTFDIELIYELGK